MSIHPRLRHHAFLLKELVKRDFQGRYAGSLLGFVWSFVQPLWMLLLFTFVFSTVMKIPLTGSRTEWRSSMMRSGPCTATRVILLGSNGCSCLKSWMACTIDWCVACVA